MEKTLAFVFLIFPFMDLLVLIGVSVVSRMDSEHIHNLMLRSRILAHSVFIIFIAILIFLFVILFGEWKGVRTMIVLDTMLVIIFLFGIRTIYLMIKLRKQIAN